MNDTSRKVYEFSQAFRLLCFALILGVSLVLGTRALDNPPLLDFPSQLDQMAYWLVAFFTLTCAFITMITPAPKAVVVSFVLGFSVLHWGFLLKAFSIYRIYDTQFITTQNVLLSSGVVVSALGMILWSRDQRRHFSQISHLNAIDSLTGLYNTKTFHEVLETEIGRIRRYKRDLSLILIRIDAFKVFNEDYGYHLGDEILKTYGKSIKSYLRRSDMGCRFSGSEFAILLPETPIQGAKLVTHRLRNRLADFSFSVDEQENKKLTTSAAIVELHRDDTPQTLIQRLEISLDTAKARGPAQVTVES
jgi:diguanylate cyclase (GGDEF)-like protein